MKKGEKAFDSTNGPLRIRHRTIEAEVNGVVTNFGVQTLKYLAAAHLRGLDVNRFTVDWLKKHPVRKSRPPKSRGVTKERIQRHIERLTGTHQRHKQDAKLYDRIRFICRFLNEGS